MKFIATYTTYNQVSEDTFKTVRHSAAFDYTQSISDVMDWLSTYVKQPTINDVCLSQLDEIGATEVSHE